MRPRCASGWLVELGRLLSVAERVTHRAAGEAIVTRARGAGSVQARRGGASPPGAGHWRLFNEALDAPPVGSGSGEG